MPGRAISFHAEVLAFLFHARRRKRKIGETTRGAYRILLRAPMIWNVDVIGSYVRMSAIWDAARTEAPLKIRDVSRMQPRETS
jgi:hypothetical protein